MYSGSIETQNTSLFILPSLLLNLFYTRKPCKADSGQCNALGAILPHTALLTVFLEHANPEVDTVGIRDWLA